jgi:hypothetical protein
MIPRVLLSVGMLMLSAVSIHSQSTKPSPSPTPVPHKEAHRWFDIEALTLSSRYRYIKNNNGQTANNQQQWQFNGRGRFKFDQAGKYSVVTLFETGNSYTAGWNNTGLGTGDPQPDIFPKQLYFDARPIKQIEIQFGGIGINSGENTEITAYDNDSYLTGERIVVRGPKQFWFDEISLTNGYVGDFNRPNVFRRLKHLDRSNYHQFLVRKKINKRVSFSADYTFDEGVDTLRQAVKVNVPKLKFVDGFVYENYERIDPNAGYGFALIGDKRINRRLSFTGGFVKISHQMLNSDRFPRGERLYFSAPYKLTRELTINPLIIQGVGPLGSPTTPRTRFEIVASYNILEALHHYRIF